MSAAADKGGDFRFESSVVVLRVHRFWNLKPHPLKITKGGHPRFRISGYWVDESASLAISLEIELVR